MTFLATLADIEALEARPYADVVPARTTTELIARSAARFAGREAFRYLPDGNPETPARSTTYQALIDNIYRAAHLFSRLGIGPNDAVAILAPNIPETHFALWGAQVVGRACLINYMLQADHMVSLLKAARVKLIVALGPNTELDIWSTALRVSQMCDLPVLPIAVKADGLPAAGSFQAAIANLPSQPDPAWAARFMPGDDGLCHQVAACFHTGGTTGTPKLALHTHANEVHTSSLAPRFYGFDENTVEINGFPLFHVAGAFVYGLSALSVGATQVLPTLSGMRHAAFVQNYWRFCERERVTALACVPTVLSTVMNVPVNANISTVKVAYTGGSPLSSELASQFEKKLAIPVRSILGMTESAGLVCIEPLAAARVPGSVGLRLPFTRVRVVRWRDAQAQLQDDCAVGETGVVIISGPHVSPGYSDPARNAGMFCTAPDGGHWLISGDLGHLDAHGYCHITGRAKDVIIRGSHNIDPGLVEEAFLAHPAVALCAVVGEPDPHAGELPVAFVTLKPGQQCLAGDLLARVGPTVYERPATPKRVTILDALPMTAIGKIFKPALRLMATEFKLTELLQGAAPDRALTVRAVEHAGGQKVFVQVSGTASEAVVAEVRGRLAAIAIQYELVFG